MDQNAEERPPSQSPVGNPITAAITFGLSGAALVAIGAVIRGHDIWKEAMVIMSGGGLTGGFAGLVGYWLYVNHESIFKLLEGILEFCAFFAAPAMGNLLLRKNGFSYLRLLIDLLIGTAIATAFICVSVLLIIIIVGYIYNRNIFTHLLCCFWCNVGNNDEPQPAAAYIVSSAGETSVDCVAATACEATGSMGDFLSVEIENVDCQYLL